MRQKDEVVDREVCHCCDMSCGDAGNSPANLMYTTFCMSLGVFTPVLPNIQDCGMDVMLCGWASST